MSIKEKIESFVETHLEGTEHFLVEIDQKGTQNFPKIFVYLDGDNGITINDCAKVSKAVNTFIEENDLITGEYAIDISSPGIDKPFVKKRQYVANIGRRVKISFKDDVDIEGKLLSVSESEIQIESIISKNAVNSTIEFNRIDKTIVLITF